MARKTENSGPSVSAQEALEFHAMGRPGKLEVVATKPMATQRDLSLAYSPGVAVPVLAIAEDPSRAFDYTTRGNMVAVISNGTAILGLGNLGALASKPVMEGKAVLFKRFADVDSIDLEVDTEDADEFINCVRFLGPSFGGINLEDIKAPECFIIEQRLRELMDIPVFHDDQHGTAIISAAGLINALEITGRDMKTTKMVCNGAGAAGIACIELMKAMGFSPENIILCDTKGVVFQGRTEGMNQWKSAHAVKTEARSLAEALDGADVFLGLSAKGALTTAMVQSMAKNPIIFAMANPDPEITPEEVAEIRTDAIMATGRSDYPNQVNNVLGFPYIFRGALDVRATTINDDMKIAAAQALAALARQDVPDDVAAAYQGNRPKFGPNYIIPVPFDPRLISAIPIAVAKAAMDSGVARKPILDLDRYAQELSARRDPIASTLQRIYDRVRRQPKRIVFAEGEEEQVMRAAVSYVNQKLGTAILLGRDDVIKENARHAGIDLNKQGIEIINARLSRRNGIYTDYLYERMQRKGFLFRDCQRLINNDRNHFAACMVALGDADGIVTGVTRNYSTALDDIRRVIDAKPGHRVIGVSIVLARGKTVLVADTAVHDMPNAEQIADIAEEAAGFARRMGYEPRLAMLAYSTFGHPQGERSERVQEAVRILDKRRVDFEYDGEMAADVALNARAMAQYPFIRLTGPANVLIMPAFHSASISTKMLQELGGSTVIGPLLVGLNKPVQIVSLNAKDSDIVNMAAIAAYTAGT
ncbi:MULTISPECIES: NADP-dependent malic enzyme [unclassified Mesorhizobium]|uniref:NADP-dependent malic enzyme n=1 Tax=unclassified Mesorhizobium TaxID=325217 RepID=UPI000FCB6042|nr:MULTISPECIES: NADP-dependent malic enzyme [unclassified Mesorhizobium]RVA44852.1 NADP-dependent malic enzyme [Mesorhizobium sp. M7A.F.Ca.US.001.01.1.1]RUY95680.1 NADP-dependent malic enzyme [Mesorhizobium sp. M7A.F.Ca.CA.001.12.2.1]RUZ28872.1 NADP-dependent malic enzyme [Mesorhizobium sp. M7A.F.Ca.US.007.01.2.1]RUZ49966.1 NADP-dependent malic enzyme [Mesorhizobium sp. M7A.F.Ca.US.003.02.1.1]RUZ60193.1 NADP-dependent malic enzyme [Mesorhizobium sp. M7A.F.Ca.US.007.01.1.1]